MQLDLARCMILHVFWSVWATQEHDSPYKEAGFVRERNEQYGEYRERQTGLTDIRVDSGRERREERERERERESERGRRREGEKGKPSLYLYLDTVMR